MMQFHDQRVMGLISKKQDQSLLLQKGKRTKRQRQLIMSTTSSSSCSSGDGENVGFCDLSLSCGGGGGDPVVTAAAAAASPANSDELDQSIIVDDVEEDMANCLILLAQGSRKNKSQSQPQPLLLNSKAITTDEFECKTCNRRFPSFQALGGHRASHKKPKSEIKKVPPPPPTPENYHLDKFNNSSLSLQITRDTSSNPTNNNKLRIHECSICGAEFASGQALGGHMRRHRPLPVGSRTTTATTTGNIDHHESPQPQQAKKPRLEVLGLDLNLPAPEDDILRESKFTFGSKSNDQVIVFAAASPLVGCHY